MNYSFTQKQPNITWYRKPITPRLIFRLWVSIAWLLLLCMGYPLFTYTSTSATIMQRYSSSYAVGLLVYLIFLLGGLLFLFLPERYVTWVALGVAYLNANPSSRTRFVMTLAFSALLALTTMRLWEWGYNPLLWLSILGLTSWLSALPLFWEWGLQGWPIKWVSPNNLYSWLAQYPHVWLTPLLGVGVLLVSNVLGFSGSRSELMLAVVLVPGIAGLLIYLRWPPIGLLGLVFVGLVVPSPHLPGGLNAGVVLLIALLGLQLVMVIVEQRPMRLVPSRTVWPLVALVLSAILSFGVGQLPWFAFAQQAPLDAQLGGLGIFVLAAGAFLLIAHQIHDLRWLRWVTWLFIALAGLHVAGWVIPGFGQISNALLQPGTYNNSLFWVWLVALAGSQAAFNNELHLGWRAALGGVALATLYVGFVLNNDWKSGYLPGAVVVGALISLRSWKTGLLMAIVAYPVAMYLSSEAIATDDYSYSTRVDALLIMLEIIKVSPIVGLGPANYYWYTPLFPIRGWAVQFNSHNNYVDILAQTGLVGMVCFLWIALEVGWLGWQLKSRVPAGFAQAYVYGAVAGLAGMMAAAALADWVLPFTYNIGFTGFRMSMLAWMFLGGLVCIEQIYRNQDPT